MPCCCRGGRRRRVKARRCLSRELAGRRLEAGHGRAQPSLAVSKALRPRWLLRHGRVRETLLVGCGPCACCRMAAPSRPGPSETAPALGPKAAGATGPLSETGAGRLAASDAPACKEPRRGPGDGRCAFGAAARTKRRRGTRGTRAGMRCRRTWTGADSDLVPRVPAEERGPQPRGAAAGEMRNALT